MRLDGIKKHGNGPTLKVSSESRDICIWIYQDTIDEALNQTKKKICMLKINENCVSMNNKRVSKTITDFYLVDKIEIAQNVALEFFQFAIFCQFLSYEN